MSWTSTFIDLLGSSQTRMYLAEVVTIGSEPGINGFKIASHYGLSGDDSGKISMITTAGHSIRPGSWSSVVGAFDVFVTSVGDVLGNIQRGSTIQVRMGFRGWATSAFEPILLGRVTRITRSGRSPQWCISCLDLYSATSYRIDVANSSGLFDELGTTTLTANSAIGDTTYDGVAFSNFERESGGANGAVLVATAAGAPYFRAWSALTATTLTIDAAGATLLGTTDIGASSADIVYEVAYMEGHPLTIARKILLSTGTASANGAYDVYPNSWGLGIGQQYLDEIDMDRVLTIVQPASGSYVIKVGQLDPVDDPRAWMEATILAPFGLFFSMRQGLLTIRAAQDPTSAGAYTAGFELVLADVIEIEQWDAWDPDAPAEYTIVTTTAYGTSVSTTATVAATLPAYEEIVIDVSTCLYDNKTAVLTEIGTRLGVYYTRIPELFRARVKLRAAVLAAGDIITVTLGAPWLVSRRDWPGGYDGRRAVVTAIQVDYWRGFCTIDVRVYPDGEGAWQ